MNLRSILTFIYTEPHVVHLATDKRFFCRMSLVAYKCLQTFSEILSSPPKNELRYIKFFFAASNFNSHRLRSPSLCCITPWSILGRNKFVFARKRVAYKPTHPWLWLVLLFDVYCRRGYCSTSYLLAPAVNHVHPLLHSNRHTGLYLRATKTFQSWAIEAGSNKGNA